MKRILLMIAALSLPLAAQTSATKSESAPKNAKSTSSEGKPKATGTTKPKASDSAKSTTKAKTSGSSTPKSATGGTVKKTEIPAGAKAEGAADKVIEPGTEGKDAGRSKHGKPAVIAAADLDGFDALMPERKRLLEGALAVAAESPWLPYVFGASEPAAGGFDCSGAMYFVMRKSGLKPPRSSADQFFWLKEAGRLTEVPAEATTLDHPAFAGLRPGDLLFWYGTYEPTDGRKVNITHVAMYLGREKKGGNPVMINATDGRSYRGKQANGYGVYDFKLPKKEGRSRFAGYGTPPGMPVVPSSPRTEPVAAATR